MARRIFLHVGTPKTGTTYLQSVLWANKSALEEQGVLLPLKSVRDHFYLSVIARNAKGALGRMPATGQKSWQRMLQQVAAWRGDVIISHELFAVASPNRAAWTLKQLREVSDEVHVIVTGRDFARQVPAEWQQSIKQGGQYSLDRYLDILKKHEPLVLFWKAQNLPVILANWAQGQPVDRVHLITVPPIGAPRGLLWQRFATLVDIDPSSVDQSATRPNESLGAAEIETLRRVNAHLPEGGRTPKQQLMMRQVVAEELMAARPDPSRFALPPDQHGWIVESGAAMVEELKLLPYDVVGELDELLPPAEPASGRDPDDVQDSEVAEVAVETLAALVYRTADSPARRPASTAHMATKDVPPSEGDSGGSMADRAREMWTARIRPRLAQLRR